MAFSFFVNHVLDGAAWARERLAAFAGQSVELRAFPLPTLLVTILPDGRVGAGGTDPKVIVTFRPLPFKPQVEVSGDARLADELRHLARHLRWDVEEDLSRVLGDAVAHRVVSAARGFARWQGDSAARIAEALADYGVEEARLLVRRAELAWFAGSAARLRAALDELEQRIARLG